MKLKRTLFISGLIVLFLFCYQYMDSKYDPFARYNYLTPENESIIRSYITSDADIDYIISQKIKPEQFMDFIELPDFKVKNILYYEICKNQRDTDHSKIIEFVNRYRNRFTYQTFDSLIANYSYETLIKYYEEGYLYLEEFTLVEDAEVIGVTLDEDKTILNYRPSDLVVLNSAVVPNASIFADEEAIYVREEVLLPLAEMVDDFNENNKDDKGKFIVTSGFISYDKQINIYKNALKKYGAEEFEKYSDYPGRNEQQLGYTITFKLVGISKEEDLEESDSYKWLQENAHTYGFVFRYPKGKEKVTGKEAQLCTLRFVGRENAKQMYNEKRVLNEFEAKDE